MRAGVDVGAGRLTVDAVEHVVVDGDVGTELVLELGIVRPDDRRRTAGCWSTSAKRDRSG
jgi:hypothetical protein